MQDTVEQGQPMATLNPEAWHATHVPEERRLAMLPKLFGERLMIRGEHAVYNFMSAMCSAYGGGFWDYYELANGAVYMVPTGAENFELKWHGNGYEGRVSAHAAGIIVTLCALSEMSFHDRTDTCAENYHKLREVLVVHPEGSQIYLATD
ncbi:antirestriction protein [Aquabacterium commune]|uniref:Antirestriction protein n=2 Tax=Aquabacterium TaxID=92793 RepID=A0A4R6QZM3_9BURK|nr:antirestriction protein [Aquabacterium commune]TDP78656.1 antirestriction protein [Aquabacterium commune]